MALVALAGCMVIACGDDGTDTTAGTTGTSEATTTSGSTTTQATTSVGTSGESDTVASSSGTSTTSGTSSGTTDTGVLPPDCGNGQVEEGEECDDGNADDADACTNACTNAVCGDGIVGPGEACDDGNTDDADACTNACAAATCGDGVVQAGSEECDDANADDTDACLSTCKSAVCGDMQIQAGVEECDDGNADDTDACTGACKNAVCGDGFAQAGVEECDDGNAENTDACVMDCKDAACGDGYTQMGVETCDDANMVNSDMCTTLCKAPACDDKIVSGSETDVDCGGQCMSKCANNLNCKVNADCQSGFCGMGKCGVPTSCKAILAANPAAANGKYTIDVDGMGPLMPFDVYCDMKTSGGGWTIFYGKSTADNEQPIVSDVEVTANDPLTFKAYNLNRAKKIALSAISTETLLVRKAGPWLRVNSAAFDASLAVANSTFKKAVMLTASDNATANAFLGWANYNLAGGGDFGISRSPDGNTNCNTATVQGFDHHATNYRMLNCNCDRQYFYSYSVNTQDGDAHYEANTALGAWAVTAACTSGEGGGIELYAAMR